MHLIDGALDNGQRVYVQLRVTNLETERIENQECFHFIILLKLTEVLVFSSGPAQ